MSSLDQATFSNREDTFDPTTVTPPENMESQTDSSVLVNRVSSSNWRKYWIVLRRHSIIWVLLTHFKLSSLIIFLQFLLNIQFLILAFTGGSRFWIFFVISSVLLVFSFTILLLRVALYYRECFRLYDQHEATEAIEYVLNRRDQEDNDTNVEPQAHQSFFSRIRNALRRARRDSENTRFGEEELVENTNLPIRFIEMRLRRHGHERDQEASNLVREYLLRHLRLTLNDRDFTAEDYDLLLRLDEEVQHTHNRGMTKRQIERFPTYNLSTTSSQLGERCSICIEDYVLGEKLITLGCFHSFHYECGCKWLEVSKKCPICMLRADGSDLEALIPLESNPIQTGDAFQSYGSTSDGIDV